MRPSPASRSNGSRQGPCAHFIRFTEEENRRLHKARGGYTVQAFARAAVLRAVVEVENKREQAKSSRDLQPVREARRPQGLGIRERLGDGDDAPYEVDEPEAPAAPAPATVTVQVQSAPTATASSEITTLARMVVAGGKGDRRRLLQSACQTLAQSARTKDESLHLADLLDAEIKRLDGAPSSVLERVRARMRR